MIALLLMSIWLSYFFRWTYAPIPFLQFLFMLILLVRFMTVNIILDSHVVLLALNYLAAIVLLVVAAALAPVLLA